MLPRNPISARFALYPRTILAIAFLICSVAALVWPVGALMRSANRPVSANGSEREESESLSLDSGKKNDVDAGRFGRGASFKDYFGRREQMTEMLRGLPYDLAADRRIRAIRQLEQQQSLLLSKTSVSPSTS